MLHLRKSSLYLMLLLVGAASLIVAGCTPASAAQPPAAAPTVAASGPVAAALLPDTISVADAAAKRDAGAFIRDVRQPDEWNEYHIPGSTLIPLDQLETRLNEVPKDIEVVVVCRSGNRSQPGRDVLKNAGFAQVTSMSGGLKEWKAAGLPTVAGP
jgi:rhodanese-related sulfurtransferase